MTIKRGCARDESCVTCVHSRFVRSEWRKLLEILLMYETLDTNATFEAVLEHAERVCAAKLNINLPDDGEPYTLKLYGFRANLQMRIKVSKLRRMQYVV